MARLHGECSTTGFLLDPSHVALRALNRLPSDFRNFVGMFFPQPLDQFHQSLHGSLEVDSKFHVRLDRVVPAVNALNRTLDLDTRCESILDRFFGEQLD